MSVADQVVGIFLPWWFSPRIVFGAISILMALRGVFEYRKAAAQPDDNQIGAYFPPAPLPAQQEQQHREATCRSLTRTATRILLPLVLAVALVFVVSELSQDWHMEYETQLRLLLTRRDEANREWRAECETRKYKAALCAEWESLKDHAEAELMHRAWHHAWSHVVGHIKDATAFLMVDAMTLVLISSCSILGLLVYYGPIMAIKDVVKLLIPRGPKQNSDTDFFRNATPLYTNNNNIVPTSLPLNGPVAT